MENFTKPRGPRVVVVGAGIAGVGAVGVLRQGGIHDITLLEAQARAGGRLETRVLENGFIEMGAQFLHGKNEVYDIAEREGMLMDQDPEADSQPDTPLQFCDFIFRTSDRLPVQPDTVNCNLQVLEDLQLAANSALEHGAAQDVNVSVGQFFRDQYQDKRRVMQGSDPLKTAMFRWLEDWGCQDAGGYADQLSLPGTGQYFFYPGSGIRQTTSGMEAVFQVLLRDSVPPECLRLNKAVKVIDWKETAVSGLESSSDNLQQLDKPVEDHSMNNNLLSIKNLEQMKSTKMNGTIWTSEKIKEISDVSKNKPTPDEETKHGLNSSERTDKESSLITETIRKSDDSDVGRTKCEISDSADYSVRIQCEDGDVFYADHVIITSSVGFLSSNPDFFHPQLPLRHQDAIASMGFGTVAKMCLFWDKEELAALWGCGADEVVTRWQQCFFGMEVEGMVPLWLDGTEAQLKSANYTEPIFNGRQWYEEVCFYSVAESHELCLIGWIGGEGAIVMESLPVSEVKAVLHELLTLFLNKPALPAPSRLIRTEWHSNPYTRGAYSFLATGVPLELQQVMSEPLPSPKKPVIQLAGEACSKHYYSTAHGALESGQKAARVILHHHHMTSQ